MLRGKEQALQPRTARLVAALSDELQLDEELALDFVARVTERQHRRDLAGGLLLNRAAAPHPRATPDDAVRHADAALAINEEFGFDKFRPERGNMAVSNAYTLSAPAEGGGVLLELGLRDARAGRRLRCKLAYAPSGDDEMRLARLAVVLWDTGACF